MFILSYRHNGHLEIEIFPPAIFLSYFSSRHISWNSKIKYNLYEFYDIPTKYINIWHIQLVVGSGVRICVKKNNVLQVFWSILGFLITNIPQSKRQQSNIAQIFRLMLKVYSWSACKLFDRLIASRMGKEFIFLVPIKLLNNSYLQRRLLLDYFY